MSEPSVWEPDDEDTVAVYEPQGLVQRVDRDINRAERRRKVDWSLWNNIKKGAAWAVNTEHANRKPRRREDDSWINNWGNDVAYDTGFAPWFEDFSGIKLPADNRKFTPEKPRLPKRKATPALPAVKFDISTPKSGVSSLVNRLGGIRKVMGRRRFRRVRRSRRRFSRRRRGSKAVTFQHDAVSAYRGRRLSRGKRKAFRRSKMFIAKQLNTQIVRRVYSSTITSTAGTQVVSTMPGLFSLYGAASYWDDMYQIYNKFGNLPVDNTTVAGGGLGPVPNAAIGSIYGQKMIFKSGFMEMDMTNTGATPCIVEIYTCVFRGKNSGGSSPATDLVQGTAAPTGTTALTGTSQQYWVPFDSKAFTEQCKVMACKKIYLDPSKSSELTMGSRGCEIDGGAFADAQAATDYGIKGRTKFWLLVVTGAPAVTGGTSAQFSAVSLSITTQRTYKFKVMPVQYSTAVTI